MERPEICTADNPDVEMCVFVGEGLPPVEHDYRPYVRVKMRGGNNISHTFLRCVHCHVVTCGDANETDPCIEPYHHKGDHRTRLGVRWPKGSGRPKVLTIADVP